MDGLHVVVVDRFGCWLMMSIHKRCCCCFVCFGEFFLFLYMYACEKKRNADCLGARRGEVTFLMVERRKEGERESQIMCVQDTLQSNLILTWSPWRCDF